MTDPVRIQTIRRDFPALQQSFEGKPPIYFDNACTTLVPQTVITAMNDYYLYYPACGGWRSRHRFSREVTTRVDGNLEAGIKGARQKIQEFIKAGLKQEIIFTSNTTHAINLVALGFNFQPGDIVLLTDHEHNSNLVPWLRLQSRGLIKIDYLRSLPDGRFDLDEFRRKCSSQRVRLVSLAYTSNLTGYNIPAREIIEIAHHYGARVLLDGAQTVPHQAIDVQALGVDLLAFSMHKMCGPKGIGILYAKSELLENRAAQSDRLEPVILGGGTVNNTSFDSYGLLDSPEKFEAGVQNYAGQIAAGTAVDYLLGIGMADIQQQELLINQFLTTELHKRYGGRGWFDIIGPQAAESRGGILTFLVKRPNCFGISDELNRRSNIMIRDGAFCVHAYLNQLLGAGWSEPGLPSGHRMVYRLSLYFYNTLEECRIFLDTLDEVFQEYCYLD
jgi:cysteine desulfurase/selenocysteine lyase